MGSSRTYQKRWNFRYAGAWATSGSYPGRNLHDKIRRTPRTFEEPGKCLGIIEVLSVSHFCN